jgi:hypothetical protein
LVLLNDNASELCGNLLEKQSSSPFAYTKICRDDLSAKKSLNHPYFGRKAGLGFYLINTLLPTSSLGF